MRTTLTIKELVKQFSGALESRDATRLTNLRLAMSLSTAEKTAMQTEHARLVKKYGENSRQAVEAAARITVIETENASLAAQVIRAGIPIPATAADEFVVYGRVLDTKGTSVTDARLTAVDGSGASLAKASVGSQGVYELRVPLKPRKNKKATAI